jgi:hypothetical protein
VTFHVFMVMNVNLAAFWAVTLCSLVEVDVDFRGAYCLHRHGDQTQ